MCCGGGDAKRRAYITKGVEGRWEIVGYGLESRAEGVHSI